MPYIQKYCQANHGSPGLYRTYSGITSDRFTVKQDLEPYCVEVSLAGRTAYTVGQYPNDRRDMPYWFTKEKIIAPYPATLSNFSAVIESNTWWRINLSSDTIPDYNANNAREETFLLPKSVYPTATGADCYRLMDATNGSDGYNSRATRPIRATPFLPDLSYSYSPSLAMERVYSRSRFYRLRVYKNDTLIDTIVTIGCVNNSKPAEGYIVAPAFIFEGFSTDQCPPDTCSVDCGTYVCCYNSQGISTFNYTK